MLIVLLNKTISGVSLIGTKYEDWRGGCKWNGFDFRIPIFGIIACR
jgi:hypothetical protein